MLSFDYSPDERHWLLKAGHVHYTPFSYFYPNFCQTSGLTALPDSSFFVP